MAPVTFKNTPGIDLQEAMRDISIPFQRESVNTVQNNLLVEKDAIIQPTSDGNQILGLVPKDRPTIPYQDMMSWVVEEFENTGVPFKLNESSILNHSNLFQTYLFDGEVLNPDGQEISPMLILQASQIHAPLKIDFGTFRFVCSNGVVVGETIQSIRVRASEMSNLLVHSIRDEIRMGIDQMSQLSRRYDELENEDMTDVFRSAIKDHRFPAALKRHMVQHMEGKGLIEVHNDKLLKGSNFLTAKEEDLAYNSYEGDPMFTVRDTQSAWGLYNDLTELATHTTKSAPARMYYYRTISKLFAA